MSTRCRTARTIDGFPLTAGMSKDQFLALEKIIKNTTEGFTGEMAGEYLSLTDMSPEKKKQLIEEHYLYNDPDDLMIAANTASYWPAGRGIFMNKDKTFIVWCCEEDHTRFISMQKGGNLSQVVGRLSKALEECEKSFNFVMSEKYGCIASCPTNIGTGIRCSVLLKIPKLSKNMELLKEITARWNLQVFRYISHLNYNNF